MAWTASALQAVGDLMNAATYNAQLSANMTAAHDRPWGNASAAGMSIPNETWTTPTWTSSNVYHGMTTGSNSFVAPLLGGYLYTVSITGTPGATGMWAIQYIYDQGGTIFPGVLMHSVCWASGLGVGWSGVTMDGMAASSSVWFQVYQNTGSAQTINMGANIKMLGPI